MKIGVKLSLAGIIVVPKLGMGTRKHHQSSVTAEIVGKVICVRVIFCLASKSLGLGLVGDFVSAFVVKGLFPNLRVFPCYHFI